MRATMKRRLDRIERRIPKPPPPESESAVPIIKGWLAAWGVVPGPKESLAETTARAMGISVKELRSRLLLGAYGGGPE